MIQSHLVLMATACAQVVTTDHKIKGIKYSDKVSTPLILETFSVVIEVNPTSQIFHQSTTLTFKNYSNQTLEGEFIFPLPEESVICGFAVDMNGTMVEATIVEKNKAQKTFDTSVRKRESAAFIEAVIGNQYRTKIYPWEKNSNKTVKIDFISPLKFDVGQHIIEIPYNLSKQEKLSNIELSIKIRDENTKPTILTKESYNFQITKECFVIDLLRKDLEKLGKLKIQIPLKLKESVLVENNTNQNQWYFDIKQQIKSDERRTENSDLPIAILWDNSLSSEDKNLQLVEFKLLKNLSKNSSIDLYFFSNEIEFIGNFTNINDIMKIILETPNDGGTNLIQLSKLNLAKYQYALLFTDGIDSMSSSKIIASFNSSCPIYVFNSSVNSNQTMLRSIAQITGGAMYNLDTNSNFISIVSSIGTTHLCYLFSEFDENEIVEVYPSMKTTIKNESFHMNGILLSDEATIVLNFGFGNEIVEKRVIKLSKKSAVDSKIIGYQWAQQCLKELNQFPEENKDQILSIGRQFSIVTEDTSLMVLETLEQFLEHKIAPPESRIELYKLYKDHIRSQIQIEQTNMKDKLKEVKTLWEKYLNWYNVDYRTQVIQRWEMEICDLEQGTKDMEYQIQEIPNKSVTLAKEIQLEVQQKQSELNNKFEAEKKDLEKEFETLKKLCEQEKLKIQSNIIEREEFKKYHSKKKSHKKKDLIKIKADETFIQLYDEAFSTYEVKLDHHVSKNRVNKKFKHIPIGGKGLGKGGAKRSGRTTQTARLSTGGSSAMDIDEDDEDDDEMGRDQTFRVSVKKWTPEVEYLKTLQTTEGKDLYKTYLQLRENEKNSPAFYLDVCDYLFKQNFKKESLKVLSNLTELEFNTPQLLRIIAYKLEEIGEIELSIEMFRKVLALKPEEPQSYRDLALVLEKSGKYKEALQLFYKVIIGEWDSRFDEIELTVLQEMNRLIHFHGDFGLDIPKYLINNTPLDLRIVMGWDTDLVDIDIHTTEPSGEMVFFGNKLSKTGGLNSADFTGGYGPETYQVKKAFPGTYKIQAKYFQNSRQSVNGGTTILLSLFTNYAVKDLETCHQITIRLNEDKQICDVFEIEIHNEELSSIEAKLNEEKEKNKKILEIFTDKNKFITNIQLEHEKNLAEMTVKFDENLKKLKTNFCNEKESLFGDLRKESKKNSMEQAIFEFEYL